MGSSNKTDEKHRHNSMEKLIIHDIAGLTLHGIEKGLIESSVQQTTEQCGIRGPFGQISSVIWRESKRPSSCCACCVDAARAFREIEAEEPYSVPFARSSIPIFAS